MCAQLTFAVPARFHDFEKDLPSLEGKVVCVTGCTTGTGFIAARTAAKKGAHVVMLNRQSARAEAAEKSLLEVAPGSNVTSVACDLQSFDSLPTKATKLQQELIRVSADFRPFSDKLLAKPDKFEAKQLFCIDVLCNNAGVMALADEATKDGYDVQMQTNHLSHFLLTKELYPLLEKAAQERGDARIVNHSSGARKFPSKELDADYLGKNGGSLGGNGNSMFFGGARWQRYHQTKLANAVFTLALDERLRAKNSKVKALCAAPGLAATNLQVTTNQADGFNDAWMMRFAQSGEDGTMPLLTCCVGEGVQSGEFYEPDGMAAMKGKPTKIDLEPICTKPESRNILWHLDETCGANFHVRFAKGFMASSTYNMGCVWGAPLAPFAQI
ncbi:unnamed protein product [Symbiodinium sp. CCMP2456]|nr:unnamed protein product [Symbiodinium sp. CCMP2456]